MAFDPFWNPTSDSPPPVQSEARATDALVATVREIASELLSDVEQARSATHDWQDQELGYALVDAAISDCLTQLARTGTWGRSNQGLAGELWKVAGSHLQLGWLQSRARNKPLGYAGDYEMLARIVARRCCEDPLGRHFDRFFQNQSAPRAVRSRTEQIAISLSQHGLRSSSTPYQLVSVGCGPGIDVANGITLLPEDRQRHVLVRLLDLDQAGLDYASRQIARPLNSAQIITCRENLFRLARNSSAAELLGQPNFLVCSGLFDYLGEDVARGMLALFWRQLAPGGRMLIGNFVPNHPARAYMEWIGSWYLIYRTPDQFADLAASANIPDGCWSLGTDRTGTDLFLIANKE